QIRAETERRAPGKIWAEAAFEPKYLVHASGTTEPAESLKGRPVLAFCGVGNPESFRRTLQSLGADVRGLRAFRDHHAYIERDLVALSGEAKSLSVSRIVCTQKDLVKIPAHFAWPFRSPPSGLRRGSSPARPRSGRRWKRRQAPRRRGSAPPLVRAGATL
ncbi:MAG: tetraacyldisaccharide 4'-kinase, partial [Planctomycetota bacterium]